MTKKPDIKNNGVLKREQVSEYLKNLNQNERRSLRELGVKFGRYHVFLYKLIKFPTVKFLQICFLFLFSLIGIHSKYA